jgi:hypothetical protein
MLMDLSLLFCKSIDIDGAIQGIDTFGPLLCCLCHGIHLVRDEGGHGFSADRPPLGNFDDYFGKDFRGRQFNDCYKIVTTEGLVMAEDFPPR